MQGGRQPLRLLQCIREIGPEGDCHAPVHLQVIERKIQVFAGHGPYSVGANELMSDCLTACIPE